MSLTKEDINWLKEQVNQIDEGRSPDLIESSVENNGLAINSSKVFTAVGHDPIDLDENVNEFLASHSHLDIIDIQWTQIVHPTLKQVIFYAHIHYVG